MASPTLPNLGSTLLKLANEKSQTRKRKRVGASFDPIDTALKGGLDYGRISCISGEKSKGNTTVGLHQLFFFQVHPMILLSTSILISITPRLVTPNLPLLKVVVFLTLHAQIAIHCLITHILSSPTSQVAVIDTTGTFDLLRLHEMIVARVRSKILTERARQIGNLQPEMSPPPPLTEDAEKSAENALERVKILRVFDFVGVLEAVGELSEELRDEILNGKGKEQEVREKQLQRKQTPQHKTRTEIADSDEEDEEKEDMLFASPRLANEDEPTLQPSSSHQLEKPGMIIIDNITQPLNLILKPSYTRAQSLITTFLNSLRHLTQTHDIATLLLNTASAPKSTFNNNGASTMNAPQSTYIPDPLSAPPTFSDQVSIFASTSVKPTLGKTFAHQLDLHLLVSSLPKRRRDAEIVVGGRGVRAEVVGLIEVLEDRGDERVGLWGVFCIDRGGSLRGAF